MYESENLPTHAQNGSAWDKAPTKASPHVSPLGELDDPQGRLRTDEDNSSKNVDQNTAARSLLYSLWCDYKESSLTGEKDDLSGGKEENETQAGDKEDKLSAKEDKSGEDAGAPLFKPDEVLDILLKTPAIKEFIECALQDNKTVGNFNVHEKEKFKILFKKYLVGKTLADHTIIDEPLAEKIYNEDKPEGFNEDGTINLDKEKANEDTYIHEAIHSFCSDNFSRYPIPLYEGVTEYFTKKTCRKNKSRKIKYHKTCYQAELSFVDDLISIVGEDLVKKAYFSNETKAFEKKIEELLVKVGKFPSNSFDGWKFIVETKAFSYALSLIQLNRAPEPPSNSPWPPTTTEPAGNP